MSLIIYNSKLWLPVTVCDTPAYVSLAQKLTAQTPLSCEDQEYKPNQKLILFIYLFFLINIDCWQDTKLSNKLNKL